MPRRHGLSWGVVLLLTFAASSTSMASSEERAVGLLTDPRLRGVALSDLESAVADRVDLALSARNPAGFDATIATALVSADDELMLVDVIGRAKGIASLDRTDKRGLAVARVAVPLDHMEAMAVVSVHAFADMHPTLDVSLTDQVAVLEDLGIGFRRVWPIGIGAADSVRRPGKLASLTPATQSGRLVKSEASKSRGGWNRGLPFLPMRLPAYGRRPSTGEMHKWSYKTRVAFHAWPGQGFIRGYVSRGCVILRDDELEELFAVVQALPADLAFATHATENREALHPLPYEEGVYWRLTDFGRPGKPAFRVSGNLYVIEKVEAHPPDRNALVDIYHESEERFVVTLATARGCGPVPLGMRGLTGDRCVPELELVDQ